MVLSASALSGLPEPSSVVRFMLAHVRVGQLNFLDDQEDFLRAALRLDNISQRDHLTFSTHPARPVSRQDRGSDCGFESNNQFITSLLEPKYGLFCRDRLLVSFVLPCSKPGNCRVLGSDVVVVRNRSRVKSNERYLCICCPPFKCSASLRLV